MANEPGPATHAWLIRGWDKFIFLENGDDGLILDGNVEKKNKKLP